MDYNNNMSMVYLIAFEIYPKPFIFWRFLKLLDQDWSKQIRNKIKNNQQQTVIQSEQWGAAVPPEEYGPSIWVTGGYGLYEQRKFLGWKILSAYVFFSSFRILFNHRNWCVLVKGAASLLLVTPSFDLHFQEPPGSWQP